MRVPTVLMLALVWPALTCERAAAQGTSFPVSEYLHGVLAGKTYLGGTPPKVVGARSLKEFKYQGRYVYVIQMGVRRASRDKGDGTFVVLKADTYGAAIAHLLDLSPETVSVLRTLFPQALPRKRRFPTLNARVSYRLAVTDPGFLLPRARFALSRHPDFPGVVRAISKFGIGPGTYPLRVTSSVALADHPLKTIYNVLDWASLALNPFKLIEKPAGGYAQKYLETAGGALLTETEERYLLEVPALVPRLIKMRPTVARAALEARKLVIAVENVATRSAAKLGPGGTSRVFWQSVAPGRPAHPHSTVRVRAYVRASTKPTPPAFAITSLAFPPTRAVNARYGDLSIGFSREPTYPVQVDVTPAGCPSGLTCPPSSITLPRPTVLETKHLLVLGIVGCRGDIKAPVTVTHDVAVRETSGVRATRRFAFTCTP